MIQDDRLPPQNMEAEQAVLGSMLIEQLAIDRVSAVLEGAHFYRDIHRRIWDAAMALSERSTPVDLITMQAELESRGHFEEVGGFLYLQNLMDAPSSAANVEYYAGLVYDCYLLRRLLDASARIAASAKTTGELTAAQTVEQAEQMIAQIGLGRNSSSLLPLQPLVEDAIAEFHAIIEHKGPTGFQTPFGDYNYMTGGLHKTELTIVGGRPSMGKTSAMVQLALHHAFKHGPVAFFSLEMGKEQITKRILFSEARVDSNQARSGYVSPEMIERVDKMAVYFEEARFYVDDTPTLSILELRSKARRLHATTGLSLLCVDYLQLVSATRHGANRTEEIGEVSRGLKALARELNIPVIALAQLSRAVENRPDKRPMLSDLRESGNIEADADVVTFLYREAYYKRNADDAPVEGEIETCEWIIAKQRNGPTGVVQLGWHGRHTRFENLVQRPGDSSGAYVPEDDPYADESNWSSP